MTTFRLPTNPTIIRAKHDASNQWFFTLRSSAQDSSLSFEARGILWYLLSKADDWEIKVPDLMREGRIGRDKVKNALIELANANYLIRPKRFKNNAGQWDWTPYILHEAPVTENPSMVEPSTEIPSTVSQSLETSDQKPVTANPSSLQNTEDKTQKQSTEDKLTDKSNGVPPVSDCPSDLPDQKKNSVQLLEAAGVRLNVAREFADMPEAEVQAIIAAATGKELDGRLYRTLPAYIVGALKQRQTEIAAQEKAKAAEAQKFLQYASTTNGNGQHPPPAPKPAYTPPAGLEAEHAAWGAALGQLESGQLDRDNFDTWLRDTGFVNALRGVLAADPGTEGLVTRFTIQAKNEYAVLNLQHRLYRTVKRVLRDVYGSPVEIVFIEKQNAPEPAGHLEPAGNLPAR